METGKPPSGGGIQGFVPLPNRWRRDPPRSNALNDRRIGRHSALKYTANIDVLTLCGEGSWHNILLDCKVAEGDYDTPCHSTTRRVCGLYFPIPHARRGC